MELQKKYDHISSNVLKCLEFQYNYKLEMEFSELRF